MNETYSALSTAPLTVLVFLLPFLTLYEVGTLLFLSSSGAVEVVRARLMLSQFFDVFGVVGFHLPPFLLAAVLLSWHVLRRERTRLRGEVIAGMAAESFLWMLPLLVLAAAIGRLVPLAQPVGVPIAEMAWPARLTLALGAGLYEEMVFRLMLIGAVHFLLVDLAKTSNGAAYVAAAAMSAVAFAGYHNIRTPGGGADLRLMLMYGISGVYFAALFVIRGFGIAAATHALYDVVALLVFRPAQGQ